MIGYNGFNNGIGYGGAVNQGAGASTPAPPPVNAANAGGQYGGGASYTQNQVLTATPEQILIMLFDAAIRFNREAQKANDEGNIAKKLEKIGRVFNIISELSSTLDRSVGGDIAEELDALYQFHLKELGRARTDNTNKHLKFVEKFLVEWRQTWMEVIQINKSEATGKATKQSQPAYNGQGLAIAG